MPDREFIMTLLNKCSEACGQLDAAANYAERGGNGYDANEFREMSRQLWTFVVKGTKFDLGQSRGVGG